MFMSTARALGFAAPLLVSLACDGLDVTQATGLPDAALASPEPVPIAAPPENSEDAGTPQPLPDGHTPASQTGETPLPPEDTAHEPVTPPPRPNDTPDAGATPSEPDPVALDCSALPSAPLEFESLEGFTSSEDFVFDADGNYVGVDGNGNLVRISKSGQKQLWAPSIGSTAGMGMLPDGSVVFCEVAQGAIKRAYPNGSVVVVLGGLLYPNGLDIGPDGFIYVAENSAGRVRRIDPDTGEFSIVALGLQGPNGVAFSNDPGLLYVGSFEGSGVYKIELDAPGQLGHASVFARPGASALLDPVLPCPDQEEGADCESIYYAKGRCQALANVVDCMPVDACPDLPDGEFCYFPESGSCQSGRCVAAPDPCDGLSAGDACEDTLSAFTGECQDSGGVLYCTSPNPCKDKHAGEACEDPYYGTGQCVRELDYLYCEAHDPCEVLAEGDACEIPYFGAGTCQSGGDALYCTPPNVCDGLAPGDACADPNGGVPEGTCQAYEEYLYCWLPNVCDGLAVGDACEDPASGLSAGTCQDYDGFVYCGPPNVCDGLAAGDPCEDPNGGVPEGTCQAYGGETLYCSPPTVCDGLAEGDPCRDEYFGAGTCQSQEGSPLYCAPPNTCEGLAEGDRCVDPYGIPSTCQEGYCASPGSGGGIDGLGVDACGNVYASEYVYGNLWRITPAGEIELAAFLPSSWIPNIKWGRGVGGFSSDIMYVANRDNSGLFAVSVGVPGVTEFYAVPR
jgi:sugar lactone lactonase YvrE